MSPLVLRNIKSALVLLFGIASYRPTDINAQTLTVAPPVVAPSPLATVPNADQQQALRNVTPAQIQQIQAIITPQLQQAIQYHQQSTSGSFRAWQDIVTNGTTSQFTAKIQTAGATKTINASSNANIQFVDNSGVPLAAGGVRREYHPATAHRRIAQLRPACCHPIPANPDQDGDGLPDNPDIGDLEGPLARAFMPTYFISIGEQQQFATFGNYVPWTVNSTVGTNPPNSYYHVTPLGLTTDSLGNQIYAIRVDYLSLWNADGGLVGGGAACFYSYFGLDNVIQQLSGHYLDDERSVMLLAAPAVMGQYNPDPNANSLYSIYTAAHEGTVFDQSTYTDFSTPVPAGNHVNLAQSVSKHSTYGFNPDYYPITPAWFIAATNDAITTAYLNGNIDFFTYSFIIAAADDTFFGCLVERFGDKGGVAPNPTSNVGEVSHPLNSNGFIQDNSAPLHLSDKLNYPVF